MNAILKDGMCVDKNGQETGYHGVNCCFAIEAAGITKRKEKQKTQN